MEAATLVSRLQAGIGFALGMLYVFWVPIVCVILWFAYPNVQVREVVKTIVPPKGWTVHLDAKHISSLPPGLVKKRPADVASAERGIVYVGNQDYCHHIIPNQIHVASILYVTDKAYACESYYQNHYGSWGDVIGTRTLGFDGLSVIYVSERRQYAWMTWWIFVVASLVWMFIFVRVVAEGMEFLTDAVTFRYAYIKKLRAERMKGK